MPKDTFEIYKTLTALPQGKRLFSTLFSQKAPYFSTIHMQVQEMDKNRDVEQTAISETAYAALGYAFPLWE